MTARPSAPVRCHRFRDCESGPCKKRGRYAFSQVGGNVVAAIGDGDFNRIVASDQALTSAVPAYLTALSTIPAPAPGIVLRVKTPPMIGQLGKDVQCAIATAGYNPGRIDGEYGNQTAAAVRTFQLLKGLATGREVGRLTAKVLGIASY